MKKKSSLPPLVLGESLVKTHTDASVYSYQVAQIIPSLQQFNPLENSGKFESKTYALQINDLKMIASATTPVCMSATEFKEINLMIPFYGTNMTTLDGKIYRWAQGEYAVLIPAVSRFGTSTTRSMMTFDLNPKRILETAQAMLGIENVQLSDLNLHEPRLIPLSYGGFSFEQTIRKLCLYTDQYLSHTALLHKMGLDDQFYRVIVMMLLPEKFFIDSTISHPNVHVDSRHAIRLLIDYTKNTTHLFHTLSDLEKFTGLSIRVLQLAFKKYLNTTPVIWLREQKMMYARKLLIENQGFLGVTTIALECGFTNFSLFAKYYREQFGELPSETRQKLKMN